MNLYRKYILEKTEQAADFLIHFGTWYQSIICSIKIQINSHMLYHIRVVVAIMLGYEDDNVHTNEPGSTDASLVAQLTTLLSHMPLSNNILQKSALTISLSVKLNENKYSLWSLLIRMKIGGQGKFQHLISVLAPPDVEDPNYPQ